MLRLATKGWIGTDIGTHTVKMVQVEKSGSTFQLKSQIIVRRNHPWIRETFHDESPMESRGEILAGKSLLGNLTGRKAATCTSMALCDIRAMRNAEEDLEQIEKWLSDELGPIGRNQSKERVFGQSQISPDRLEADREEENLLVVSMSREWSDFIVEDHKAAGLECMLIDGLPQSLSRASLLCPNVSRTEPVAIIDWGFTRTTFIICVDGEPLFARVLRESGLEKIFTRLKEKFSLSHDEVQTVLIEKFSLNSSDKLPHRESIANCLKHELAQIQEEATKTMSFIRSYRRQFKPTKLLLTGGGAVTKGVEQWFESFLDVPTQKWGLSDVPQPDEPLLAVACSLSMLGVKS